MYSTHLQPQLNKAVSLEEKDIKGDKNPKDFILFFDSDFVTLHTRKDNTGDAKYVENMVSVLQLRPTQCMLAIMQMCSLSC